MTVETHLVRRAADEFHARRVGRQHETPQRISCPAQEYQAVVGDEGCSSSAPSR